METTGKGNGTTANPPPIIVDEDQALKDTLAMLIDRLEDPSLHGPALEALRTQIRTSTASMTSIPKALKYLRPHYQRLVQIWERQKSLSSSLLASILSVLSMTMGGDEPPHKTAKENQQSEEQPAMQDSPLNEEQPIKTSVFLDTLKYRLAITGEGDGELDCGWGHEYVRHLAMQLVLAHDLLDDDNEDNEDNDEDEVVVDDDDNVTDKALSATKLPFHYTRGQLVELARQLATYLLAHNAEADACDLLYEIGKIDLITGLLGGSSSSGDSSTTTTTTHQRVCLYLQSLVPYEMAEEGSQLLRTTLGLLLGAGEWAQAMAVALRLNSPALAQQVFDAAATRSLEPALITKQLAFMLARQGISIDTPSDPAIAAILCNQHTIQHQRQLTRELEILDPKSPEDIYKSHLQDTLRVQAPSARNNMAGSFVNGLVNAGFGTDGLKVSGGSVSVSGSGSGGSGGVSGGETSATTIQSTTANDTASSWIYRNKDGGLTVAAASIGLINLWAPDEGLAKLDPYLYVENPLVKAGAILGIGIVHSGGVHDEADPALALLREYLEEAPQNQPQPIKMAALLGLGLAYTGTARRDVAQVLYPHIGDSSLLVAATAALSLAHVFVGSGDGEATSVILQTMLERSMATTTTDPTNPETASEQPPKLASALPYRLFILALGLIMLQQRTGTAETSSSLETILETLDVLEASAGREAAKIFVTACSNAGTGNVLAVQELLQATNSHASNSGQEVANEGNTVDPSDSLSQTFATLGIALVAGLAGGDEVGREMSLRLFSQLAHQGGLAVRLAVPLALALSYPSGAGGGSGSGSGASSVAQVIEQLGKLSHDHNKPVAINAILALGLVGAGTNNARMAQMLRHLAAYYQRDPECLVMVRVAQGLVHLGKGTISISPLHLHRQVLDRNAVAGLLSLLVTVSASESGSMFLDDQSPGGSSSFPSFFYLLASAMHPRHLITVDADTLTPVPALLRVGQAVETVGQAGRPKTITGFQTHTSPVLLGAGERAELATDEWVPVCGSQMILENVVLVKAAAPTVVKK